MAIPRNLSILAQGASASGVLSVTYGGTGVTTSTGTGSVVLSNSPSLVTPTLGAASATSITASLGTVGAPSYTFSGDTNTGIYSPAADTLAFVEGGTEAMRIDSSGNVGISGNGGSSTNRLSFTYNGVTGEATIGPNSTGGSTFLTLGTSSSGTYAERLRIDSSGRIGFGVTPFAWGGIVPFGMDLPYSGYIANNSSDKAAYFGSNTYYNGTNWIAKTTGGCTVFAASTGNYAWFSGASVSAGAAFTSFTQTLGLDGSGNLSMNSGYGSVAVAYGCRAWVNFNGQGTVAIRASGNVSSITDNGVGNYTLNLSTAMPDTNYNWVGAVRSENDNNYQFMVNSKLSTTKTTSALQVKTGAFDAVIDVPEVNISIFR